MFYKNLEKVVKRNGQEEPGLVAIPEGMFRRLLAAAIRQKGEFDERFYLETYPDIAAAVRNARIKSGFDHYIETGYFEHRVPKKFIVDESYYLQENADVAEGIQQGRVKSAQEHFDSAGFAEGRSPYRNFALF